MEGHGDHRLDFGEIDLHAAVIVRDIAGKKFFIVFLTAMNFVEFFDPLVCLPDGGKAGGLCSHDIHADPEISAQVLHSRSHELHHLILYITVSENLSDNGQSHILRTDARPGLSLQVNRHHLRHIDIIRLGKKLLHQLRAAFSHSHGPQCSIAGMAVGTQDHLSPARQHLPGELMDHSLMRRNIDTAVFLRAGEPEHMIIFIDGSADGAERVVAVGQHIRHRKFLKSGCACRLDNAHKGDVMRCQFVKTDLQLFHVSGKIVILKDSIRDGVFRRFLPGNRKNGIRFIHDGSVYKIYAIFI